MFKGLGNIASLLKEAQNIGPKMEQVNNELKEKSVVGTSGGDMVKVHANGLGHVLRIEIDPVIQEGNDFEMLADLLPAAINQAIAKSKQLHVEAMKNVTGNLQLPAGAGRRVKEIHWRSRRRPQRIEFQDAPLIEHRRDILAGFAKSYSCRLGTGTMT